jgi:hypothetical protein
MIEELTENDLIVIDRPSKSLWMGNVYYSMADATDVIDCHRDSDLWFVASRESEDLAITKAREYFGNRVRITIDDDLYHGWQTDRGTCT